jgi:alpha-L-fucosidase
MGSGHGNFTEPAEGTSKDIRFTRSKDKKTLYAIILGWPENTDPLKIASLSSKQTDIKNLVRAELLSPVPGNYVPVTYSQDETGLKISLPERLSEELAYVIKLTFSGEIPGGI